MQVMLPDESTGSPNLVFLAAFFKICCLSQCICRKLAPKHSSQYSSGAPAGMWLSQAHQLARQSLSIRPADCSLGSLSLCSAGNGTAAFTHFCSSARSALGPGPSQPGCLGKPAEGRPQLARLPRVGYGCLAASSGDGGSTGLW